IAQQLLDRLLRQQAARQQRFEDRVVQILRRNPLVGVGRARVVVEPAREQHVRQLRDQLLEIDALELVAGISGVPVFHGRGALSTINSQLPISNSQFLQARLVVGSWELGVALVVVLLLAGNVELLVVVERLLARRALALAALLPAAAAAL